MEFSERKRAQAYSLYSELFYFRLMVLRGPEVPVHVIRPSDGLQIGFRPKSRFPPIFVNGLLDFNKKAFLLKKVK